MTHVHCWHYTTGYTNGLGNEGADTFVCCHCGTSSVRQWHTAPDPRHGKWFLVTRKVYDDKPEPRRGKAKDHRQARSGMKL